MAINDNFQFW